MQGREAQDLHRLANVPEGPCDFEELQQKGREGLQHATDLFKESLPHLAGE